MGSVIISKPGSPFDDQTVSALLAAANTALLLLSPEPLVVKQPKFTRVEEPTLLCNQVGARKETNGRAGLLGFP
jgi:hypothetical protein